jgi:hypothetical protein
MPPPERAADAAARGQELCTRVELRNAEPRARLWGLVLFGSNQLKASRARDTYAALIRLTEWL